MANWVFNYMDIYGNKEGLEKFRNDVVCGSESEFSFNKIVPQPKNSSAWASDRWPGCVNWRLKYWGIDRDAFNVELSVKENHLYYKFNTAYSAPLPACFNLIELYSTLDFEILFWEPQMGWTYELDSKRGQITTFNYLYEELVPWRNNQCKMLYYEENIIKNTLRVYKEKIMGGSEKEDLPTATDDSASKDSELSPEGITLDADAFDDDDLLRELDNM